MKKALLYVHGGSGNHGCEAIARTLSNLLGQENIAHTVLTANIVEDRKNGLADIIDLLPIKQDFNRSSIGFVHAYLMSRMFGKHVYLDMLSRKDQINELTGYDTAIAIGGDTYSYGYSDSNTYMHNLFLKKGLKTVLWGCSIDPQLLNDPRIVKDLKKFDNIIPRESITYDALKELGFKQLMFFPDMAFGLGRKVGEQSVRIKENTIGINLSPLIMNYQKDKDLILRNFRKLMSFIVEKTDLNIALIPHVVWDASDDRKVLKKLYKEFHDNERVILIDDCNCMELKDVIARCRLFICSRTHASIAAYSTGVPTIVLGYSVKARGIARDIWGTDENYVKPVLSLKNDMEMINSLSWMLEHEVEMKSHLERIMPSYIERLGVAKKVVSTL